MGDDANSEYNLASPYNNLYFVRMFTRLIINTALVLLIMLGFFAKFHPSDEEFVSKRYSISTEENLNVVFVESQTFAADSMLFHTCHIGHTGCLFIFPNIENLFSYNLKLPPPN